MSDLVIEHPATGVVRLVLNRPDSMNALTKTLLAELREALHAASADRDCRVVILTGAGEKAFCAGVDLKNPGFGSFLDGRDPIEARIEWTEYVTEALMAIRECNRPVIAAVNGVALGGGLSMALLADIRIGALGARLADGYIRNGLSGCELGTSFLLPRLIGQGRAMEFLLTGRFVEAKECERIGLFNSVVEADRLQDAAVELATQIAANSPFAVTMTKQVARANSSATDLHQAMLLEMRTQVLGLHTADGREARAAIAERREPKWTGYRTR